MKKLATEAALAALVFSGLTAQVHAAEADAAAAFQPTGPWAADYGDDYCRLVRTFAHGGDELAFAMERTQPGNVFRLLVIGDGIEPYRGAKEIGYRFLPEGDHRKSPLLRSQTPDGSAYFDLGLASLASPAPGAAAQPYRASQELDAANSFSAVELSEGLTSPIRLETGPLEPVIGALQACTSDLIAHWGVDASKHAQLSRAATPAGNPSDWLPGGTYAFSEFAKFAGGMNAIRVMVDASGKPTDCMVQRPTAEAKYNQAACEALMENARFEPALDSEGQPLASYWMVDPMMLMGPPGGR